MNWQLIVGIALAAIPVIALLGVASVAMAQQLGAWVAVGIIGTSLALTAMVTGGLLLAAGGWPT